MRRVLIFIAASMGFVAAPLAAETVDSHDTIDAIDSEVCEGCQALLDLALAHPRRQEDRRRDRYRHPAETLSFFRVKPGMTVVDVIPAGGWYTRILVPYLGRDGHYIGINPGIGSAAGGQRRMFGNMAEAFPRQAAEWTGAPAARIGAWNSDGLPAELEGTVDRVLIFREMHNLYRFGWLDRELTTFRGLLKPSGLLGVVEHRARADAPATYADGSMGYMRERDVVGLMETHGFDLVARSEINANPKDSADWDGGVWALSPTLEGGETDRVRYEAVGESDRMTLLFRKRA